MATASLSRLLAGFSREGQAFLRKHLNVATKARSASAGAAPADRMETLARALLTSRGEASGVALAAELLALYAGASSEQRQAFFALLATGFEPDADALEAAWARYGAEGAPALPQLARAVESPRQELFRRINLAPGGTAALVAMRATLLDVLRAEPGRFDAVDDDLGHLLKSWFNRGFLTMAPIDWSSPAALLERVIRYEAVHHISDWDDLRRRLDPADRRCFAFFHPAMPGEPLIFVEVALTRAIADNIQDVLRPDRTPLDPEDATTAIFYSISNCQPGLRGISFGHFLIKQVASDLKRDLPKLETFATLSPIPGLCRYLRGQAVQPHDPRASAEADPSRALLMRQAAGYLSKVKTPDGKPADPVARFHLGNGAELYRLNWGADTSAAGLEQSAGMMVNYRYDLARIEENHEAYAHGGLIACGEPFRRLAADVPDKRA